ncbi:MAG: hypothetical protein LBJ14_02215 [Desulfarculales bacterium]|jgi:phosphatidylethanolamine-binding protein (PEBP) family uncharacterized protein|nr:hypothetical protein [Desulfarculales bacterium]
MRIKKLLALFLLGGAMLMQGCAGSARSDNFQTLEVSFEWQGNAGSLSSPNPEIVVSNIPAGTAFLQVRMKDLDYPHNHGGGLVSYDGKGVIPVGALQSYDGPQPPAGQVHTYVFTVTALNQDKSLALGEGSASRQYPEK